VKYSVELKPRAEKDLRGLQRREQQRIVEKLRVASDDLHGTSSDSPNFNRVIDYALAISVRSSTSNLIKSSFTESCIDAKLTVDWPNETNPASSIH
jgi:mRNA-degrading endonuclease RelE of RelBE toxin-antitoxin system